MLVLARVLVALILAQLAFPQANVDVNGHRNFVGRFSARSSPATAPFRQVTTTPAGACDATIDGWAQKTTAPTGLFLCDPVSQTWQAFSTGSGAPGSIAARLFQAGPTSGAAATPTYRLILPSDLGTGSPGVATLLFGDGTWRALAEADVPALGAAKVTSGVFGVARLGTGSPSSTSVLFGDGAWRDAATTRTLLGLGGAAVLGVGTAAGTVAAGDHVHDYVPLVGGFVPLANIPATLAGKNAATATALAANGTNCPAGQAPLGVDASGNAESCFTPGGGGGFTDLAVSRTSATVETVAAGRIRFPGVTYDIAGATATITAGSGSGAVQWYITPSQVVVVEHATAAGLTIVCSGCTASQVTTPTVPDGAYHLATTSVAAGAWSPTITDRRAPLNAPDSIDAGAGLTASRANGRLTLAIDTADVPRQGQTNVFTGVNDFSPGTLIQPRGTGLPAAGACTASTMGASYVNDAVGGIAYDCLRTGASTYAWSARVGGGGAAPNRATAGQGYEMLPMPHQTFTNGQDAFTNNLAAPFYTQFNLSMGITPGRMRVHLTGGTASASNGTAFAIYDAACNKIADATSVIFNGAIGVQEVTFASAPALTAGVYHLGYATQVVGQTWMQLNPGAAWFGLVNPASGLRNFTGSNAATGTGTGLTLPASCGTRTTTIQYPISAVLMP